MSNYLALDAKDLINDGRRQPTEVHGKPADIWIFPLISLTIMVRYE